MTDQENPGKPCPVCGTKMILQYDRDDPRITTNLTGDKLQIPMRCCKCVINILVSVDPKELEDDDNDF